MNNSYYNTNKEHGSTLAESESKTETQEELILEFFNFPPISPKGYSPEDIHQIVFDGSVPLTSVRRAMTNLTSQGKLKKSDIMTTGQYGKKIHRWVLPDQTKQTSLF